MSFILTVLAVIIADVYGQCFIPQSQHDECTIPGENEGTKKVLLCDSDVKMAFTIINEYWVDGPVWCDRIAAKALKEALQQNKAKADYKIRQERVFLKHERNETTLVEKVVKALSRASPYYMEEIEEKSNTCDCKHKKVSVRRIPSNVYYGCNGFFDTEGSDDVLTVVCLYRTSLKKTVFHKYKNIEVKGVN